MSIRPMTADEIRRALRHGAKVCIERSISYWFDTGVIPQDGAFRAANDFIDHDDGVEGGPEHAATFLLLVAEAMK